MRSCLSLSCCHTYAVVVVYFLDGNLCALFCDVVKTGLGTALRHMYNSLLAQLVCCPCNTSAVVAVSSSEEGCLTELLTEFLAGQIIISHLGHIASHLTCDVACHCERTAKHLKCIKTKTIALVFYKQTAKAKSLCHTVQLRKRSDGILRETLVELTCLFDVFKAHNRQALVIAFWHLV